MENIKNLSRDALAQQLQEMGEPAYRGKQIYTWLFAKGVASWENMTNLSLSLREKMQARFALHALHVEDAVRSVDGTEKFLFRLSDNNFIETVYIPTHKRKTVCVSSQVGCRFRCVFCASGANGFTRNLSVAEIVEQVLFVRDVQQYAIDNIVFMGIGEPLDNFEILEKALAVLTDPEGMGLSPRRLTVSTSGLVTAIEKLQYTTRPPHLALSLHATSDTARSAIMPINRKYPIAMVMAACRDYVAHTKRRITFEYTLLAGVNDSSADSKRLAHLARHLDARVNLIPYNPTAHASFQCHEPHEIDAFLKALCAQGVRATVRRSRGCDANAACGQLVPNRQPADI